MKTIIFFMIACIPLLGFVQNDLEKGLAFNEKTLGKIPHKYDFYTEQLQSGTTFQELKSTNDSIEKSYIHWDVSMGTFIPTNKAKLIGVKPTIGASFGLIYKRMTYDFTLDIRFGSTKNEYQLATTDMTDHYLGGYAGIDLLRDIWSNKKNQMLIGAGVGVDVFEIVPGEYAYRDQSFWEILLFGYDTDNTITIKESKNIYTANFNFGLMYRFYYNKKNYLGIRYRYNIVNYNSRKVLTELTGNFHAITLSFGGGILDF